MWSRESCNYIASKKSEARAHELVLLLLSLKVAQVVGEPSHVLIVPEGIVSDRFVCVGSEALLYVERTRLKS